MATDGIFQEFRTRLFILVFLMAALAAPRLSAQEQETAPSEAAHAATRIEADDEAGVIRFFVKGQLAAILDETGLHVRQGVNYGQSLTDYGPSGFADHAAEPRDGRDAE